MSLAYYNEIDPFAAQWLRNLIDAGHIAPGDVDTRSIVDVKSSDLCGYTQIHLFAGIGVWSYALRQVGWHDDRPVVTGSCPCQPFSNAGLRKGLDDERHLWPEMFRLVRELAPRTVFGEQVASNDGLAWFDVVQTDLENAGYASAALDLCAAGFGAPHIRQRLFWVGHANDTRLERHTGDGDASRGQVEVGSTAAPSVPTSWMGNPDGHGRKARLQTSEAARQRCPANSTGRTRGFWHDADWLPFLDGKRRPVEPGTLPVAYGNTSTMGRLRAYGNAIVAPVAVEFIKANIDYGLQPLP